MQPEHRIKGNKYIGLVIAVVVLAVALVALIGYIVIEKTVLREDAKSQRATTEHSSEQKSPDADSGAKDREQQSGASGASSDTTVLNADYRTGGNGTGRKLTHSGDVDAIAGSSKLKAYLKTKVGVEAEDPVTGGKTTLTPIVDRVDGSYAAVFGLDNAYVIVGPKDGTGPIDIVAGTQQLGMKCEELRKAKVPGSLVDNKCTDASGGVVAYK